MKRYLYLLLLLPLIGVAQTEKISFTKKFTYISASNGNLININLYYSPKNIVIEKYGDHSTILIKEKVVMPISLNLDNQAVYESNYYTELDSLPLYRFEKLNKKEQVAGYTCTYYKVNRDHDSYYDSQWCIVEDLSNDLLTPINNKEKDIIKGFPVLISMQYGNNMYLLKSIQNTSDSFTIDFKKELTKQKAEKTEYQYEETVDSEAVYIPPVYTDDYGRYKSEYKTEKGEDRYNNLAIDNLEKESPYWKGIPQYCSEIDERILRFTDSKLKKHTRNYLGQLCDMYLSFVQPYGVDRRGTLDEIRYEENYFRDNKGDFTKNDQKLLDEFIKSLD